MKEKKYQIKLKLNKSNEQKLINDNFTKLTNNHKGSLGLQDDAAFIKVSDDKEIVISSDILMEGRHFFEGTEPDSIAYKSLATNVSDIIAKGVKPKYYSLNIALGKNHDDKWLYEFTQALVKYQKKFGIILIGGDTIFSDSCLTLSVSIFGFKKKGKNKHRQITRLSAKIGDDILVIGEIGSSNIGLKLLLEPNNVAFQALSKDEKDYFINHFNYPRVDIEYYKLIKKYANAGMDISDGLIGDLGLLLKASNKSAIIDLDKIPINPRIENTANLYPEIFIDMITGGDDYKILCCVPSRNTTNIIHHCLDYNITIKKIGKIVQPLHKELNKLDQQYDNGIILNSNKDYSRYLSLKSSLNYSHF